MAIDTITPVTSSVLLAGESFSFTIDDTYTVLQVEIYVDGPAWEDAYNGALGGVQAGYTVSVVDTGSRHIYTFTRDAGWNLEPMLVRVTEDEAAPGGATTETTFTYYLGTQQIFPHASEPLNPLYAGTLLVTEDDVQAGDDVGWLDFDNAQFTITDLGNGKVRIQTVAGGGSGDVTGPAVAVDDRIATFDLTTGKLIQDSGVGIAAVTANTAKVSYTDAAKVAGIEALADVTDATNVAAAGAVMATGVTIQEFATINGLSSAPSNPAAADSRVYYLNTPNELYFRDSSGNQICLSPQWSDFTSTIFGPSDVYFEPDDFTLGGSSYGQVTINLDYLTRRLNERALAPTFIAGASLLWTKNDAPTTLWFTDDTGGDHQLGVGGGAGKVIGLGTWTKGADTIGATAADSFDVNNATIASITQIRILASNPLGGAPIDGIFPLLSQVGTLFLQDVADPSANAVTFKVTSHAAAGGGVYWDLTGTVEEDFGTNWATSYSVQYLPAAGQLSGAGAPGVATGDGYPLGTTYADTTNDVGYILVDATIGANVWARTNATHTGDVTGDTALTIGAKKVTVAMLADGTDGEIITWSAAGEATTVAAGTAGHVLTSNGAGAAPTMQAAAGGGAQYIHLSGEPNPNLDTWRRWDEDGGPWNMNSTSWATNSGSSGTGSITVDPTIYRWDGGLYFPDAVTLQSITIYSTSQGAHTTFDLTYQWWGHTNADLATTDDGSPVKHASVTITNDGTTNKVYKKTMTLDDATIAAGSNLTLFFTTITSAGTGVKQRFYTTIKYTVD